GDAGDDTLTGGATGTLTMDGGAGHHTFPRGGPAGTTLVGLTAGSTDIVDGTPVIDFTGAPQNVIFLFQLGHLLAHWGDAVTPSSAAETTVQTAMGVNFQHQVYVSDVSTLTTVIGGSGADVFDVWQTGSSQVVLDGGKG